MIFRSPYPDVVVPDVPVDAFVLGNHARWAGKPAIIDGLTGEQLTYRELSEMVERAARGFAAHGLGKGDVVALVSPNLPSFVVAFFAALRSGAVVSLHNPLQTSNEFAAQFELVNARFVVTIPPLLPTVQSAIGTAAVEVAEVYVFGEAAGATPFAALLTGFGPFSPAPIDPARDLAVLPFSSGTTGLPKAVMGTHRYLNAMVSIVQCSELVRSDDTLIAVTPFFHGFGLAAIMLLGLTHGATIVTMPRFAPETFLGLMAEHRVTRAHIPPPIVSLLASDPAVDAHDHSGLRVILSGGAALAPEIGRRCAERLGCVVKQAFGLTEIQPTHVMPTVGGRLGSVGVVLPNTEVMIVDTASGQPLGPNQHGELWMRGPQMMSGYLGNPEATAATITSDGWLKTGDIGYADADGHFYIVDRLKEMIKFNAYQVAPAELEAVLLTHPEIADAAVIGIPDDAAGEIPKAYVVPRPGTQLSAEAIMAHVAGQVAPYKKVRRVELTDQIPRTPSGKILRRVLVERERALLAV